MRPRLPDSILRWTVVLALLVALVGTAWGHRGFDNQASSGLVNYIAAGGSLDDLCDPSGDAGLAHKTCDACRLVDTVSLEGCATGGARLVYAQVSLQGVPVAQAIPPIPLDPVRLSRAPPSV